MRKDPPEQNSQGRGAGVCTSVFSQADWARSKVGFACQAGFISGEQGTITSLHTRAFVLATLVMWRFPLRNECGIWLLF